MQRIVPAATQMVGGMGGGFAVFLFFGIWLWVKTYLVPFGKITFKSALKVRGFDPLPYKRRRSVKHIHCWGYKSLFHLLLDVCFTSVAVLEIASWRLFYSPRSPHMTCW